ncbi:MAG: hypothetical protein LBE13_05305, partial [Bacteroidales bacterium]|nr:hypothetical protein [Bacteroidales bacterium]
MQLLFVCNNNKHTAGNHNNEIDTKMTKDIKPYTELCLQNKSKLSLHHRIVKKIIVCEKHKKG